MEPSESRMVQIQTYPNFAYVEMLTLYLGTNFAFYQQFFRRNGDRKQFAAFMLVNVFTTCQLVEVTNPKVMRHYAGFLNNYQETQHRLKMTENLRQNLLKKQWVKF